MSTKETPWSGKRGPSVSIISTTRLIVVGVLFALVAIHVACWDALCSQTREQCDKCCKDSGLDDYYLEQCKLKCFRNSDHCIDRKSSGAQSTQVKPSTQPPPSQRLVPQSQDQVPTQATTSPQRPIPRPVERQATPPKRDLVFRWPEALNMVPGKEWETAGLILGANGMTPQHPNFSPALRAVEGVLVNFARNNPTGGELPTDELERILLQYR